MITQLVLAVRAAANARIADGYYSERALAQLVGCSQTQLHNVLKGARTLTPHLADRLIDTFRLELRDL